MTAIDEPETIIIRSENIMDVLDRIRADQITIDDLTARLQAAEAVIRTIATGKDENGMKVDFFQDIARAYEGEATRVQERPPARTETDRGAKAGIVAHGMTDAEIDNIIDKSWAEAIKGTSLDIRTRQTDNQDDGQNDSQVDGQSDIALCLAQAIAYGTAQHVPSHDDLVRWKSALADRIVPKYEEMPAFEVEQS